MCMGGGGGGGSSAAEIDALNRQREAERQAAIRRVQSQVNSIFSDPAREQAYAGYRDTVYARNQDELQRAYEEAQRKLRFSLAGKGVAGGTADTDAFGRLKQNYNDAVLKMAKFADNQAAGYRNADEQSRMNLISQAQSGLDATTAARNAQNQMALNQALMSSQNQLMPIGNLLAGIGQAAQQAQAQAGQVAANALYGQDQFNSFFAGNTGRGGTSGQITSIA